MEMWLWIILLIINVLYLGVSTYFTSYYIIGFLPDYRARPLSNQETIKIKQEGIIHITEEKYAKLIKSGRYIKSSSKIKSYSNHFKRSTYFFIAQFLNDKDIVFNISLKKKKLYTKIHIKQLSDEQISYLYIRRHDNAIMYIGDFTFKDFNQILITPIMFSDENRSIKHYLNIRNFKFIGVCFFLVIALMAIYQVLFTIILFAIMNLVY